MSSNIYQRLRALRVIRGAPKLEPEGETYDAIQTRCGMRVVQPSGSGVTVEPEEDSPDELVRVTFTAWLHPDCITDYADETGKRSDLAMDRKKITYRDIPLEDLSRDELEDALAEIMESRNSYRSKYQRLTEALKFFDEIIATYIKELPIDLREKILAAIPAPIRQKFKQAVDDIDLKEMIDRSRSRANINQSD